MKAQKSWDTPVADETRDVSDASEDIHGITDDITDDAESAEVDAEAVTLLRKRHRRMTLLVVVVIVASLVSGFCWRRSLQTGSLSTVRTRPESRTRRTTVMAGSSRCSRPALSWADPRPARISQRR